MPTPNIVVLGTGMAGFGAAHRLHAGGITPVMYDKNNYHGGHTASFRYESGFLFDVGPHISVLREKRRRPGTNVAIVINTRVGDVKGMAKIFQSGTAGPVRLDPPAIAQRHRLLRVKAAESQLFPSHSDRAG